MKEEEQKLDVQLAASCEPCTSGLVQTHSG